MDKDQEKAFKAFLEKIGATSIIGTYCVGDGPSHSFCYETKPRCDCERLEDVIYSLKAIYEQTDCPAFQRAGEMVASMLSAVVMRHREFNMHTDGALH